MVPVGHVLLGGRVVGVVVAWLQLLLLGVGGLLVVGLLVHLLLVRLPVVTSSYVAIRTDRLAIRVLHIPQRVLAVYGTAVVGIGSAVLPVEVGWYLSRRHGWVSGHRAVVPVHLGLDNVRRVGVLCCVHALVIQPVIESIVRLVRPIWSGNVLFRQLFGAFGRNTAVALDDEDDGGDGDDGNNYANCDDNSFGNTGGSVTMGGHLHLLGLCVRAAQLLVTLQAHLHPQPVGHSDDRHLPVRKVVHPEALVEVPALFTVLQLNLCHKGKRVLDNIERDLVAGCFKVNMFRLGDHADIDGGGDLDVAGPGGLAPDVHRLHLEAVGGVLLEAGDVAVVGPSTVRVLAVPARHLPVLHVVGRLLVAAIEPLVPGESDHVETFHQRPHILRLLWFSLGLQPDYGLLGSLGVERLASILIIRVLIYIGNV